jgi:hypothetical protein
MAKRGYGRHVSQQSCPFRVNGTGPDNITAYGLAATRVGSDSKHADMFESITPEAIARLNPQCADKTALASAIRSASGFLKAGLPRLRCAVSALRTRIADANAVLKGDVVSQRQADAAVAALYKEMDRIVSGPWAWH